MTYAQFLLVFLLLPLGALLVVMHGLSRRLMLILLGVCLLALVYTGPWDNLLIASGVWSFGSHRVLGLFIGRVPLEEYGFYILQVFLTGTLTAALLRARR